MSVKDKGGLVFMALMLNVEDKQLELEVNRDITHMESLVLRVIRRATIGGNNFGNGQVAHRCEFFLEDIAARMQVRVNKIYVCLKSLEAKKLITREKTRSRGREILGLDQKAFGPVLIEKFRLKVVVDNSKNGVDNKSGLVPNQDQTHPESGVDDRCKGTGLVPNQDLVHPQTGEILEENSSLDSSRREKISSRLQEELDAHEERKREYIPKGTENLGEIIARFKSMGSR